MNFVNILEIISYICAPIAIIVAIYFGIFQIKQKNKEDDERGIINDDRDISKEHSFVIDLCDSFQRDLIQQYVSVINFHSQKKLNLIGNIYVDKEHGVVHKPLQLKRGSDIFLQKVQSLFNNMDIFAAKILTEARKEEYLAYKIQGHAFCDIINHLKGIYDLYLLTNAQDYINLAELYDIWSIRH